MTFTGRSDRRKDRASFKLPYREAPDVEVELVQAGIVPVARELDLELHLGGRHRKVADRAWCADTRPTPRPVRATGGKLSVLNDRAGFRTEDIFIHEANGMPRRSVSLLDLGRSPISGSALFLGQERSFGAGANVLRQHGLMRQSLLLYCC
jgi:hypothetical protein